MNLVVLLINWLIVPYMNLIKVTEWTVPGSDQKLILEGSVEFTRDEAEAYAESNPFGLTGIETIMSKEELDKLPEFEG